MMLCSLPVVVRGLELGPVVLDPDSEKVFTSHLPNVVIGNEQNSKRQFLSLDDHSYAGKLFAYEVEDEANTGSGWTPSIDTEKLMMGKYYQIKLDLLGVSPATLLMFMGIGAFSIKYSNAGTNEEKITFFFPKISVTAEGFNQREITDIARIWNPKDEEGLMQVLLKKDSSINLSTVPYVLYPYYETLEEKTTTTTTTNEKIQKKFRKNYIDAYQNSTKRK